MDPIPFDRLTEEQFEVLDAPITLQELYQALMKMKVDSSPGCDGFMVSFYRAFWQKLGPIVLASITHTQKISEFSDSQKTWSS